VEKVKIALSLNPEYLEKGTYRSGRCRVLDCLDSKDYLKRYSIMGIYCIDDIVNAGLVMRLAMGDEGKLIREYLQLYPTVYLKNQRLNTAYLWETSIKLKEE
jgi:hypothetical protein